MRKMITSLVAMLVLMTSQAGELFVKVNSTPGSYYAKFDNQTIYNNSGIFKFFDINQNFQQFLTIRRQGSEVLIANIPVDVQSNQRKIGEINAQGQFQLIATEQLNYTNWYSQNNTITPQIPPIGFPIPPIFTTVFNPFNILSGADYMDFLKHMEDESFDSDRLKKAEGLMKRTRVSVVQISGIMDEFTFDDARLDFAKSAYDSCYDQVNYYKLEDAFTFNSNADDFQEFLDSK